MYKSIFFIGALLSTTLVACGGGAAADGEKYCNCVKDAGTDPAKAKECVEMSGKHAEKYKDDAEALAEYGKAATSCK